MQIIRCNSCGEILPFTIVKCPICDNTIASDTPDSITQLFQFFEDRLNSHPSLRAVLKQPLGARRNIDRKQLPRISIYPVKPLPPSLDTRFDLTVDIHSRTEREMVCAAAAVKDELDTVICHLPNGLTFGVERTFTNSAHLNDHPFIWRAHYSVYPSDFEQPMVSELDLAIRRCLASTVQKHGVRLFTRNIPQAATLPYCRFHVFCAPRVETTTGLILGGTVSTFARTAATAAKVSDTIERCLQHGWLPLTPEESFSSYTGLQYNRNPTEEITLDGEVRFHVPVRYGFALLKSYQAFKVWSDFGHRGFRHWDNSKLRASSVSLWESPVIREDEDVRASDAIAAMIALGATGVKARELLEQVKRSHPEIRTTDGYLREMLRLRGSWH